MCNNLGGSGYTCSAGKCVELSSGSCLTGDTECYTFVTVRGTGCTDPVEGPVAGEGCCWGQTTIYSDGSKTYCCYDNYDNIKASCANYCAGNKRYVFDKDVCQTGGWGCSYIEAETCVSPLPICTPGGCVQCSLDSHCTGYGSNNIKKVCECPSGCTLTGSSYTCKEKPSCSSTTSGDCASGYCCDRDPGVGGSGNCYGPAAKIYTNTKWLCATASPTGWHECAEASMGQTISSAGKSYICLNENGEYKWGETLSTNPFIIALSLLFFLPAVLKKLGLAKTNSVFRKR